MQQAAYPTTRVGDYSQKRAVVKLRERSFLWFSVFDPFLKCIDSGHGARDVGKPLRSLDQHGFQCLGRWIGNIVKTAASPAGDMGAHLAEVDILTAGCQRVVDHEYPLLNKGFFIGCHRQLLP
jgi:hypothetical protein